MKSDKKGIANPFATDTLSSETVMGFSHDDLVELLLRLNERLAEQETRIAEQDKEISELLKLIDKLKSELAKALKNSSTTSKPPSSDIVKPPQSPRTGEKRKIGGQKGHPRHEGSPFPESMVNEFYEYTLQACPDCGGTLCSADEAPCVVQQIEIVERPIRIDEHRGQAYWCEHCQKIHYAPLPPAVEKAGLFGPRLSAQVAYLKGAGHTSFTTIQKYMHKDGNILVQFCLAHLIRDLKYLMSIPNQATVAYG